MHMRTAGAKALGWMNKVRRMWEEAGRSVQVEGGHGLGIMETGGHRGGWVMGF